MSYIPKVIFALWTGENPMPIRRKEALKSLKNTELEVVFVTSSNLHEFIQNCAPLHPAYQYLSAIHRADYLRAYLMHHIGGGYSDIKFTQESWLPSYHTLCDSKILCAGYQEIGWRGVARVPKWSLYLRLLLFRKRIIGNGAYIFRPKTQFTESWLTLVNEELNFLLPVLKKNSANHPEDHSNRLINGLKSDYPVRWTQILGDIFHPLCLKYYKDIDQSLPKPLFCKSEDL